MTPALRFRSGHLVALALLVGLGVRVFMYVTQPAGHDRRKSGGDEGLNRHQPLFRIITADTTAVRASRGASPDVPGKTIS